MVYSVLDGGGCLRKALMLEPKLTWNLCFLLLPLSAEITVHATIPLSVYAF